MSRPLAPAPRQGETTLRLLRVTFRLHPAYGRAKTLADRVPYATTSWMKARATPQVASR